MADFVALAAVAERLIEENGRSVTITKLTTRSVDSATPWRGGAAISIGGFTAVATATDVYLAPSGLGVFLPGDSILASGFTQAGNNGIKHVLTAGPNYLTVSEDLVNEVPPPAGARLTLVPDSVTGIAVFVGSGDLGYTALQEDAVRRGAEICLFAANNDGGYALETFDQITDGSLVWKILRVEVLKPASTKLLYIFEVKR